MGPTPYVVKHALLEPPMLAPSPIDNNTRHQDVGAHTTQCSARTGTQSCLQAVLFLIFHPLFGNAYFTGNVACTAGHLEQEEQHRHTPEMFSPKAFSGSSINIRAARSPATMWNAVAMAELAESLDPHDLWLDLLLSAVCCAPDVHWDDPSAVRYACVPCLSESSAMLIDACICPSADCCLYLVCWYIYG